MNRISSRQIYFYLAAVAPVGKLLLLPTQLAHYSKNDLLFPALTNFALQALAIFFVLLLSRSNKSFYDLLQNTFGKIAAKILICIFALFLFFAALMPIQEHKIFVQTTLYDTLPSLISFSPFFLFSAYLCAKPLFSCGRMCDFLAPVFLTSIAGILLLSAAKADFGALAPVGGAGATGYFGGTAYTLCWFYDSAVLLSLMGYFRYEKGMAWKGALCYLAGGAIVILSLAVFYGVYAETAVFQQFPIAKISKYFSGITVLGRIDYLFLFLLTLVNCYYCALPLQAGVDCLNRAFGRNRVLPVVASLCINLIFFILTIFLD